MIRNRFWLTFFSILAGTLACADAVRAESLKLQQKSEVYRTPEGRDYAALSLQLPSTENRGHLPEQVLVLIDTSASQVGEYRQQSLAVLNALLPKFTSEQAVDVWAIDVAQSSLAAGLAPLNAEKISAIQTSLTNRIPAGSTNLVQAFEAALKTLDPARTASIIYLGDGCSSAHLIAPEEMQTLVKELSSRQIPVISYAIGSQTDLQLLGALGLRSGGVVISDATEQSANTAADHLWSACQAKVWYPETLKVSDNLTLLPNQALPVRADRETIYLAEIATGETQATLQLSDSTTQAATVYELSNQPQGHAALRGLWVRGQQDAGLSVPTAGQPVLEAAKVIFEKHVEELLAGAAEAAERGQRENSVQISQTLLQLDPHNVAATKMIKVQQVALQQDSDIPPIVSDLDQLEQNNSTQAPTDLEQDLIERYKNRSQVAGERLSLQVSQSIEEARAVTNRDPELAISLLKNVQGIVRSAADIDPEIRRELERRVGNVILEVRARREQILNQRVRLEQELAEQEARRRVIEEMLLEEERLEQLIDQVRALLDDGYHGDVAAFEQAEAVAQAAVDLNPYAGVSNSARFVAQAAARLEDARYLRDLRADRFLETLTQVEFSHVPFPDEPPIRWPAAPVWKALTERRKVWASVDLRDDSPSERRIRAALDEDTELQFVDTPLRDALEIIGDLHNITILPDEIVLQDAGISTDEPVNLFISGVRLRSALNIMLRNMPEELAYVIQDEVMKITTRVEADENDDFKDIRVYPVADLVIPIQLLGGGGMGGGMMGGGMMGGGGMGGGMMGGGMGGGMMGGGMFSIPAPEVAPVAKKKP